MQGRAVYCRKCSKLNRENAEPRTSPRREPKVKFTMRPLSYKVLEQAQRECE